MTSESAAAADAPARRRSVEESAGVPQITNEWYEDWIQNNMLGDDNKEKNLKDKVAIVTGANSGTGFWCATALAKAGVTVVMACRNAEKAKAAKEDIVADCGPNAPTVDASLTLDTSKLASVRAFAEQFNKKYDRLDYLINNAGIMAVPYSMTSDNYEIQWQTNHLGHFLLTSLLWKKLVDSPGQARVIQHSSGAHWLGAPKFDKNQMEVPPTGWSGLLVFHALLPLVGMADKKSWIRYGVSKLCNVLLMRGLQQRIETAKLNEKVISLAVHPGYASTGLQAKAGEAGSMPNWKTANAGNAQSAADGSLPLLMAAVSKEATNGDYFGPSLHRESKGPPHKCSTGGFSNDQQQIDELWTYSEECIGSQFTVE